MKGAKRDLLVLSKKVSTNQKEMALEVEKLHDLLYIAEAIDNYCVANEIIDINNYRIIGNPEKIKRMLVKNKLKAFQFINLSKKLKKQGLLKNN